MNALEYLGALGSLVSIGACGVSIFQARKATTAKTAAEKARNDVRERQTALTLASLHANGRRVSELTRALIDKSARVLRGAVANNTQEEVRKFADEIRQVEHLVPTEPRAEYVRLSKELNDLLSAGDQKHLHDRVSRLTALLRKVLDGC